MEEGRAERVRLEEQKCLGFLPYRDEGVESARICSVSVTGPRKNSRKAHNSDELTWAI